MTSKHDNTEMGFVIEAAADVHSYKENNVKVIVQVIIIAGVGSLMGGYSPWMRPAGWTRCPGSAAAETRRSPSRCSRSSLTQSAGVEVDN